MKPIETKRMILRDLTFDDLTDFNEYAKHPEVGPMCGWKPHESMEESKEILASMMNKEGEDKEFAIEDKKDHKMIGMIGLRKDRHRHGVKSREIGYTLSKDYWGERRMYEACKAVIKYAFDELDLEIIAIGHFPFNDQSRKVIERLGFYREGVQRKVFARYDGEIFDDVTYSLTKEEFEQLYKY